MKAELILLVFKKEFLEAFRDYRTAVPMIFMSVILGPLLTLGVPYFALFQAKTVLSDTYNIAVVGPSIIVRKELAGAGDLKLVDIGTMPAQQAVDTKMVDAAVITSADFDQKIQSEQASECKIDIIYNGTLSRSSIARFRLNLWTDGFKYRMVQARLKKLDVNHVRLPHVRAKEIYPESPFGVTNSFLQLLLGCILMMMALMGIIYPALDAVTGERERQTLEPLLMTQASRQELFAGKLLTVASTSYISVFFTLLGFFISQFFQTSLFGSNDLFNSDFPFVAVFPWPCFLFACLFMLPLCITLGAAGLMFASAARTIQQGQGYFLPLMLIGLVPLPVVLFGNIHLSPAVAVVPFLGAIVALNDILGGYINYALLTVSAVVALAFCYMAVITVSPLLAREDLLFGVDDSPARRFAANDYRRELFFLCVIIFLLMFYGSQILVVNYHLWGVALTQVLVVLLPGIAFVLFWLRLPLSAVFKFGRPRGGWPTLGAVILIAPFTVAIASLFVYLQSKILPGADSLNKLMSKALGIGEEPIWILIFVIGVLPGLCEELLFRGVILSLLPRRWSEARLVATVGTLFGAFHMSLLRFLPTGMLGALLTFIRLRADSLWPVMLLHCLHNSLSIILAKYLNIEFGSPSATASGVGQYTILIYLAAILSGVIGFTLLLRATRLKVLSAVSDPNPSGSSSI